MDIYTIGHSTHSIEEFISLLKTYEIELLVDVRSYPGSNYMPQFNKENMEKWVPENGIEYMHMPSLGGRRKKNHDIDESLVDGWRNTSFQNYAAYSLTKEYEEALGELISLEKEKRVCYMCSESVPRAGRASPRIWRSTSRLFWAGATSGFVGSVVAVGVCCDWWVSLVVLSRSLPVVGECFMVLTIVDL